MLTFGVVISKVCITYSRCSCNKRWQCSEFEYLNHGNIITKGIPSLFLSVNFFHFLMTPIDSSNDQNICVELFKATFTH